MIYNTIKLSLTKINKYEYFLKILKNAFCFILLLAGMTFAQKTDNWPVPLTYATMVYHAASGDILIFPGLQQHGWAADTFDIWAYNIEKNFWRWVTESPKLDSAVYDSVYGCPAYDSESDRIILFTLNGNTWAYDYTNNAWEEMNPESSPRGRNGHVMEYDAVSDKIILFGGFNGAPVPPFYNDTWTYDYNTNTWDSVVTDTFPTHRVFH